MLCCKQLILTVLLFRSSIYFKFVCSVRLGSIFILLYVDIKLCQHHLLKGIFFLCWMVLVPFLKSVGHKCWF
jgi:hypothetical protein